nr:cytoplasmic phosphatidylinositol transfer protein 1-like isoform X2 [Zootoca vivipara]
MLLFSAWAVVLELGGLSCQGKFSYGCRSGCPSPSHRWFSLFLSSAVLRIPGIASPSALEYTCSFLPKFSIYIETKYEDNCGDSTNIFHKENILGDHDVTFLDIAFDEIPERYYRSLEDLRYFSSTKTGRGPLREGWREHTQPIMCSYKLVTVKFEVWGLQTRVEQFAHKAIRDILLIGHRQAFAWVDEWCGMTMDEVRLYEKETQEATNEIVGMAEPTLTLSGVRLPPNTQSAPSTPLSGDAPDFLSVPKDRPRKKSAPEMLSLPVLRERANAE